MSASATAQINARINRALKDEGDAGLAAAGLTPTKAVHALWELAARYKNSPEKVLTALYPERALEKEEGAAEHRRRLDALITEGPALVEQAYADCDMPLADSKLNLPVEGLKETAYEERFGKDIFNG